MIKKIGIFIFVVMLVGFVAIPWGLYAIGLGNIHGRPTLPKDINLSDAESERIWSEFRETGRVKLEKQNPYQFFFFLLGGQEYVPHGSRLVWFVVRNYNQTNLQNKRMINWHLSGAALSIWISRNWTLEQVLAKVKEIQYEEETTSNKTTL